MNYRKANNILLALIILINLYVLAAPLLPKIIFWWQLNHTPAHHQLLQQAAAPAKQPNKVQTNRIIIPDMLLNQPIYEGSIANTYRTLDKGIWRWPDTSRPGQPGNTVLIGHRFTYTKPRGVFYELDKVHVGSQITIFWNGKKLSYIVASTKVVPATDTAIEAQTKDTRLTLYTCTPLWHPVNRLVVVAKPEVKP